MTPGSPIAVLRGASARYPGAKALALEGVDLEVRAGAITALLGPNGAGKSTLLRLVAGLLLPTGGTVRLAGEDPVALGRRAVSRLVALVPQSEQVATGFRVREVVAMGRAPHQDGWLREGVSDRAAVDDAIARCDLALLADRDVATLSGGEQRRVAVARALAQKPRLLALDEPAAFLDVRHKLELAELLSSVAERDGVGCLVAMHDLESAARVASAVVLLRAGRVVASGAPGEVMTTPRLREAFDAEIDVGVHAPTGLPTFVVVGKGSVIPTRDA